MAKSAPAERIFSVAAASSSAVGPGPAAAGRALLPAARLHAERGELDVAEATARRGLRLIGADRLRAAELLGVAPAECLVIEHSPTGARAAAYSGDLATVH